MVVERFGGGNIMGVNIDVFFTIYRNVEDGIGNGLGEDDTDDIRVPIEFINDKVSYVGKSGFNRKAVVKVFKCFKVVKRDPSIFPNVDMGARVDFSVEKGFERYNAIMNTLPNPGGVLNIFWFVRIGGGEIFVFKGSGNWGEGSGKDLATVVSKKSHVEVVEVFQTKSSIFCVEVKEIPIDPVDL